VRGRTRFFVLNNCFIRYVHCYYINRKLRIWSITPSDSAVLISICLSRCRTQLYSRTVNNNNVIRKFIFRIFFLFPHTRCGHCPAKWNENVNVISITVIVMFSQYFLYSFPTPLERKSSRSRTTCTYYNIIYRLAKCYIHCAKYAHNNILDYALA